MILVKAMLVNNRAKMQRTNSKVRKWLESHGYKGIYFYPHSRFSKDYHITYENITADFDGMATRDNNVVFFQCKTNRRATKKTLLEYRMLGLIFGVEMIWFNAVDRKGLEVNNELVIK